MDAMCTAIAPAATAISLEYINPMPEYAPPAAVRDRPIDKDRTLSRRSTLLQGIESSAGV
jgi:hypothetical protein